MNKLYLKALCTVNSCRNREQLVSALRYVELIRKIDHFTWIRAKAYAESVLKSYDKTYKGKIHSQTKTHDNSNRF